MDIEKYQVCQKCKEYKKCVINSSRKNKSGILKHSYMCLDCNSLKHRLYRLSSAGKRAYSDMMKRQKEKFPEKIKARTKINELLQRGKIIRPGHCALCNINDKLEAHHHDYNKPLEIIWLCKKCHSVL